jgi:hypothetical protein
MGGQHGGYRYPLPSEAVRNGAQNISDLAWDVANHLPGNKAWVSASVAPTFDANGLVYIAWSYFGLTWTARPVVMAMAEQSTVGGDAGVNVQLYAPHSDATTLVLQANYTKDGRAFTGAIGIALLVSGVKP